MNTEQNKEHNENNDNSLVQGSGSMLVSQSQWQWSQDEVEGTIGSRGGGYNHEYKYFLKASPSTREFLVIDNESGDVLKTLENKVRCVIYHGHSGYKLLVGHLEGYRGDSKEWEKGNPDENKRLNKLVAVTYNSPFAPKHASRGNFDRGGYSEWLDIGSQREALVKRQYVILLIPELIANGTLEKRPIFASFGGSSMIPFSEYFKHVSLTGQPSFMLNSVISYESDTKRGSNDTYNKVVFDFEKDEKGRPFMNMMFSGDTPDADPKEGPYGIRLRKRVEKKHMDYVMAAENGEMPMAESNHSDSNTIEVSSQSDTPDVLPGSDEPFNDDIPF